MADPRPESEIESPHVESTRLVFDRTAGLYAELIGTTIKPEIEAAIDRAALDVFAQTVLDSGGGAVLDVGCGTGRATAYLAERGLAMRGTDLSVGMLAEAQKTHPTLKFEPGSLTNLPTADNSLVGLVYWYSIIYTPLDLLGEVWAESLRVSQPNATVLIGFQAGAGERIERANVHDSGVDLVMYRHSVDAVVETLTRAGITVTTAIRREADREHEDSAQAFLLAKVG